MSKEYTYTSINLTVLVAYSLRALRDGFLSKFLTRLRRRRRRRIAIPVAVYGDPGN